MNALRALEGLFQLDRAVLTSAMMDVSSSAGLSRAARLRTEASRALDSSLAACTPDDFCDGFTTLGATHRETLQHVYLQAQACLRENTTVRTARGAHARTPIVPFFSCVPHPHPHAHTCPHAHAPFFISLSLALPPPALWEQAEFDAILSEHGVGDSLDKLDALLARQPELPDGSRLPLTSADEARNLIAHATLPAKRQHKLKLEQALREVEEENASLQAQYAAALPELQAASAEIAACKAQVEKVRDVPASLSLVVLVPSPLCFSLLTVNLPLVCVCVIQTATSCERWRAANA